MAQTDWIELHRLNRVWRAWMDGNSPFQTPEPLDTLRYLSEECHEARKCWMVERLPTQPRARKPDSTIYQELGQAVMLALTYLPDAEIMRCVELLHEDTDYICHCATMAILYHNTYEVPHIAREWVRNLLAAIDGYPGMDVTKELHDCHHRLGWRWASEKWAKLGSEF